MGVSTGIAVDLTALTGVLADLRRDVNQGLTPSTHSATGDLGDVARFGGTSASGEVIAGATDISYAASIAAHNVGVHIDNAYAIADMIEGAVAGYRLADALAGQEFSSPPVTSAVSTPSAGTSGLTPVFVGPLPAPKIPPQALTPSPHALRWEAYDTPRIWSMVSGEVSEAAWRQMHAFQRLSELLDEQHRRMLALRERLVAAWAPAGAGAEILRVWDRHTMALATDAMCAYLTGRALGRILESLAEAHGKVSRLRSNWNWITRDFLPESWDHAAEENCRKARAIMVELDSAIADYRKDIAVPDQAVPARFDQVITVMEPGNSEGGNGSSSAQDSTPRDGGIDDGRATPRSWPPSLPGVSPVNRGPALAGTTGPLDVSPSNPPSMLPIPPGVNSGMPSGGAYVLPGPWSREGRFIEMPPAVTGFAGRGELASSRTSVTGPAMYGTPAAARDHAERFSRQRMATEQWEVAVGGPEVIGTPQPWYIDREDEPRGDILDRFEEWIKITGLPWEGANREEGAK